MNDVRRSIGASLRSLVSGVSAGVQVCEAQRVAHRLGLARQALVHVPFALQGGVGVAATSTTATWPFDAGQDDDVEVRARPNADR